MVTIIMADEFEVNRATMLPSSKRFQLRSKFNEWMTETVFKHVDKYKLDDGSIFAPVPECLKMFGNAFVDGVKGMYFPPNQQE